MSKPREYFKKIPYFAEKFQLCGPAVCGLVAGPTECYEKKVSIIETKYV